MKLKVCLLFAIAAAISLALPAGAMAKPGGGEPEAEAHLTGTHGYRITIHATSETILVIARNSFASVSYFSLASKLKGDRIDARLPGVGRIHLHFHEHRRSRRDSPTNCRAPAELIRKGVFVGLVKIKGERDYTSAESHHVRGEIVQKYPGKCHRRMTARASSAESEVVSASTERGRGFLSFMTFTAPSTKLDSDLIFGASFLRGRGQMAITTTVTALSEDPAGLEIAVPPRSATVDPPAPFSGTATFQQETADQFSWTGDLAVELPGVGVIPLAGPKFETALCVGRRCRGDAEATENSSLIAGFLP